MKTIILTDDWDKVDSKHWEKMNPGQPLNTEL